MTDRLPPHDNPAEQAVLGSILVEPECIHDMDFLQPDHFFTGRHKKIFSAMRALAAENAGADMVVLSSKVGDQKESLDYLLGLFQLVPTATQARQYARRVWEMAQRRNLLRAAGSMADYSLDESMEIEAILGYAQESILDIAAGADSSGPVAAHDGADAFLDEILRRRHKREQGEEIFVSTGLIDVDHLIGGFMGSDLIVVAGRPGMGKTMWQNTVCLDMAKRGKHVAIFSLEMNIEQVYTRLAATESGIDSQKIASGDLTLEELGLLGAAVSRLKELPIWVDDRSSLSAMQVRSAAQRLHAQHGLDLIAVDYLGLMTTDQRYNDRNNEVGAICRGLKAIAKDLDIPVLAMAQLNRAVETRADKRPLLADLRDSGNIEQDASIVMFLYREAYYNKFTDITHAELSIAKNRHGKLDTVKLFYDPAHSRFGNYAPPIDL